MRKREERENKVCGRSGRERKSAARGSAAPASPALPTLTPSGAPGQPVQVREAALGSDAGGWGPSPWKEGGTVPTAGSKSSGWPALKGRPPAQRAEGGPQQACEGGPFLLGTSLEAVDSAGTSERPREMQRFSKCGPPGPHPRPRQQRQHLIAWAAPDLLRQKLGGGLGIGLTVHLLWGILTLLQFENHWSRSPVQ